MGTKKRLFFVATASALSMVSLLASHSLASAGGFLISLVGIDAHQCLELSGSASETLGSGRSAGRPRATRIPLRASSLKMFGPRMRIKSIAALLSRVTPLP